MAGSIPQPFIELLLERSDIQSVVGARIPLKKKGHDYWACCPFHNEKSASFSVSSQKGFFHCFGCGAHGNAIDFIRQFDNLSFTEAIESLASAAGMEVPRDEVASKRHESSRPLYNLLTKAKAYYTEQLNRHPMAQLARDYLRQRGLTPEIIQQYQIGFAPPEKSNFSAQCNREEKESLLKLRMATQKYDSPFDLFQNRIMFPIHNRKGQVVAFGGRTLGNDKAKYINSPESEVFHKSREIFGLYEALKANRTLDSLLITEGYMDAIALAQYGITNAVATLGTATNTENLSALLKQCTHLTFCFDGDNAGRNAARKAMENALPLLEDGVMIRFLLLPEGEDPDTLVRKEGLAAFQARIEQARPLSSYFFDVYSEGLDLTLPEGKGALKERALPQIELIHSRTIAQAIRSQLYELTRTNYSRPEFNRYSGKPKTSSARSGKPENQGYYQQANRTGYLVPAGTKISLALYYEPTKKKDFSQRLRDFSADGELEQTKAFCAMLVSNELETTEAVLAHLATHPEDQQRFKRIFSSLEHIPDKEAALAEAEGELTQMNVKWLESEITRLLQQQREGPPLSTEQQNQLKELYQRKQQVRQNIS